jgi:hypothetical protein
MGPLCENKSMPLARYFFLARVANLLIAMATLRGTHAVHQCTASG